MISLVSGGSRGLGLAILERLLARGDRVATFSRSGSSALATLAAAHADRLHVEALDGSDSAAVIGFVGRVVERFGGPSVKPEQPEGLWQEVAMLSSNTREYKPGPDEENRRRSIYTYWKRASPPPSMLTFDAPTRESCTVRRASTNTPLQALALWNEPFYVRAARELAARAMAGEGDDEARLIALFERCTGERPDDAATALLRDALADFRARFRDRPDDAKALVTEGGHAAQPDDAAERAAWTMVASSLLNLHQTVTQH